MQKPIREGFVKEREAETPQITVEVPLEQAPEQAQDAQPLIDWNSWPVVVKLVHRPVRKGAGPSAEVLNELTFREPTARDIIRVGGNPVRTEFGVGTTIDDKKMLDLMANLSGVMTPYLELMDTRDYNSCAYRLRGFFLPEPDLAWPELRTPTS
jgi:hypothetical protein